MTDLALLVALYLGIQLGRHAGPRPRRQTTPPVIRQLPLKGI